MGLNSVHNRLARDDWNPLSRLAWKWLLIILLKWLHAVGFLFSIEITYIPSRKRHNKLRDFQS